MDSPHRQGVAPVAGRRVDCSGVVVCSVLTGLLGMLLAGYNLGIVSGAMILIQEDIKLTTHETEIVVSALVLWAAVSVVAGIPANSAFGRKPVMALAALAYASGSIVLAFAEGLHSLVFGRTLCGIGVGLSSGTVPMYLAEVSPPEIRGLVLAMTDFGIVIAQLIAALVNVGFSRVESGWRWSMGLAGVPGMLMLIGTCCLPESPRWLALKGRVVEAEAVLKHIHGSDDVQASLQHITDSLRAERQHEDAGGGACAWAQRLLGQLLEIWSRKEVRRAALVGMCLMAANQFAGINFVVYYSTKILLTAGFSSRSAFWLSAVCCAAQLVGVVVSVASMDSLGRRPVTLASCFGCVVSLVALAVSFWAGDAWKQVSVVAMLAFLVAFGLGLAVVPWVMNAEIYPLSLRSAANGQAASPQRSSPSSTCPGATVINWILCWVVGRYSLSLSELLGPAGAFCGFATLTFVCGVWLCFVLPETRGLELEGIAELFTDPYPKVLRLGRGTGDAAKGRECGDLSRRPDDMQMALRA